MPTPKPPVFIEGPAYIQLSARDPILMVQGNKRVALENLIRDALPDLVEVGPAERLRWRKGKRKQGKISGYVGSIGEVMPHTRRIRIRVEILE